MSLKKSEQVGTLWKDVMHAIDKEFWPGRYYVVKSHRFEPKVFEGLKVLHSGTNPRWGCVVATTRPHRDHCVCLLETYVYLKSEIWVLEAPLERLKKSQSWDLRTWRTDTVETLNTTKEPADDLLFEYKLKWAQSDEKPVM